MSRICVCLVRYGQLGRIGWFGTIHQIAVERGDQVVVQSIDGLWIGTVLRIEHDPAAGIARGELLRQANGDDLNQWSKLKEKLPGILQHAAQRLIETDASASLLDADLPLDQRTIVLQFAGPSETKLGPLADEIARQFGVSRAQWLGLDLCGPVTQELAEQGEPPGLSLGPSSRPSSGASVIEGMRKVAEGSLSGMALKQFANRHREQLGLTGLYLQKLRFAESRPLSGPAGNDAAKPVRRWMVRLKSTAGQMTVGQFRKLAEFARTYGDGTLRLTSRQGIQYHGVAEGRAADLCAALSDLAMTTRGSSGNSLRNVTCCPLQPRHLLERVARQVASQLAQLWLPSAAWLDIETWVPVEHGLVENSQNVGEWTASELEHDRAYPDGYLPHKWKIGVATEDHNCINVRANDLGIVLRQMPVVSQASQIGVANSSPIVADLWIGGGLSYRLGEEGGTPVSLPILAEPLGTARLEDIEPIVRTLMNMHRQFVVDQQADAVIRRRYKRLKYFVRHLGAQAIASRLVETTGLKLESIDDGQRDLGQRNEIMGEQIKSPAQGCVSELCEHAVLEPSEDGRWQVTVGVRGGRLRFDEGAWNAWEQLLTLCRSVCVGPRHTLVFGGVESQDREAIIALSQDWFEEQLFFSAQQLGVVTCVALPTCPLAVADAERSERAWRKAVAEAHPWLEELLVALGRVPSSLDSDAGQSTEAGNRKIRVAVSGCTNGCSLPLLADVGFVAESAGLFRLYVGGGANGLGVPLETLSGPEQLVKTSQRLCQELREVVRRGGSGQKWFTQKSESWNFTWPQRQN